MGEGYRSFRRGVLWLLALVICALLPGCRHTPSYSDIKVDKGGGVANTNEARPESERSIESGAPLAAIPDSSPLPDLSASPGSIPPAYFDAKTGQIRNLPLYPGSKGR